MTHWRKMHDSKYIFAFDLDGKDVTLTIDRVEAGTIEGEKGKKSKKPLCYFRGVKSGKPLALNITNCKIISKLYGDEADAWAGKRVTLYPTTTQFGGEERECVRIRPRVPPEKGGPPQELNEPMPTEPPDPEPAREPGQEG